MRFTTFTDIHFHDKNPSSRIDNYLEALCDKMEQIRLVSKKLSCSFCICAGDVFHAAYLGPSKVSHYLTQVVIEEFRKFPCPIYCLVGNHDITGNLLDSIDRNAIGTLFKSDVAINISLHPAIHAENSESVWIGGVPYSPEMTLESFKLIPDKNANYAVLVAHCFASQAPGDFYGCRVFGYEEIAQQTAADVYVFGHDHRDQGIVTVETAGKKRVFINVGAISRGSLDQDNLNRDVAMGFVSLEDLTTKQIKLKVGSVDKVFNLKKKEKEKHDIEQMEKYVDSISMPVEISTVGTVQEILDTMTIPDLVRDKMRYYLKRAESEVEEV